LSYSYVNESRGQVSAEHRAFCFGAARSQRAAREGATGRL